MDVICLQVYYYLAMAVYGLLPSIYIHTLTFIIVNARLNQRLLLLLT
jgi:hypothetical protein